VTAIHKHYTVEEWKKWAEGPGKDVMDYVAVSTGILQKDMDKLAEIIKAVPTVRMICIDVANGYSEAFVQCIRDVRKTYPQVTIMAGNVVTKEMTEELIFSGADVIKVGIGPGSVCTTRKQTGVGYPQLSAVLECADAAHGLGGRIVSDGGCTCPGDVCKAFGAGADFVMLGTRTLVPLLTEAEAISDSILKLLQLYEQMIKLSVPRSCPRYKVIPKMHVLLHIVEDVVETRWNYRHYHCFIEGDVIGQLKDLTVKLPKADVFSHIGDGKRLMLMRWEALMMQLMLMMLPFRRQQMQLMLMMLAFKPGRVAHWHQEMRLTLRGSHIPRRQEVQLMLMMLALRLGILAYWQQDMHLMLMMLAGIQVHWQWAMQLMLMNSSARATRDAARAHDAGLQTGGRVFMRKGGGMLAGHEECAGEVSEENGHFFKVFYGMSSDTAMKKHSGGVAEYRSSEGKTVKVPYRGPIDETIRDLQGGVRSACTYVGASTLRELPKRTTFIRCTQQLNN
ncbi:GMPR2, partial [Symbiodinium sp. KB8]